MMDPLFNAIKDTLVQHDHSYFYYSLPHLQKKEWGKIDRLPYCLRILLEGLLRNNGKKGFTTQYILDLLEGDRSKPHNILFLPGRVLLQDFTGIPVLNDLAALRAAMTRRGLDASHINPVIRTDLVVDHSLQVDYAGCALAKELNEKAEFQRNQERYQFLRWSEQAFQNLRIIPPGNGIVHQLNLEVLADVISTVNINGEITLIPDSVLGTDSHTPMVNGMGVVGWGVGGIEALAAMVGYPIEFNTPQVVGLQLSGNLPENVTATDLTLTITNRLRSHGVVGKFVEVFGNGVSSLRLEDRAMISNMTPESGATITYFPVDEQTLDYLRLTGRDNAHIELVEAYFKAQQLFRTDDAPQPDYDEILELDLNTVQPVVAGPKRPFDLITVQEMAQEFPASLSAPSGHHGFGLTKEATTKEYTVEIEGHQFDLKHGAVIMAAITSCTNTSNPAVLMGAGLLAKKAVEKGLHVQPFVKTSLTPGSLVVDMYLINSGLMSYLAELGFQVAGHGCATCIGNSGPLPEPINQAVNKGLVGTAVISGNRNFEGRIHKSVKACYLASPLLVMAYALAGTVNIDLTTTPLGSDQDGTPVFLADIWPNKMELDEYLRQVDSSLFTNIYAHGLMGNQFWQKTDEPHGTVYDWNPHSSYLREPPFILEHFDTRKNISKARVLAKLGDSITTDHISPAGKIQADSDCGRYLEALGCDPSDLNTYGARRGNHEAMLRGTFSNPRLKNELVNGKSGDFTRYLPENKEMSIFEASRLYQKKHIPLIILAGKQYGTGSSRDWAAKGPFLLGVRAVLAESYERIHRSNLIMMGILPLQFLEGENAVTFGLDGKEKYSISDLATLDQPGQMVDIQIENENGKIINIQARARLDTPVEVQYFRNGGILPTIFNDLSVKLGATNN